MEMKEFGPCHTYLVSCWSIYDLEPFSRNKIHQPLTKRYVFARLPDLNSSLSLELVDLVVARLPQELRKEFDIAGYRHLVVERDGQEAPWNAPKARLQGIFFAFEYQWWLKIVAEQLVNFRYCIPEYVEWSYVELSLHRGAWVAIPYQVNVDLNH